MNIIRLKRKVPENLYDEVLHDQNYYIKPQKAPCPQCSKFVFRSKLYQHLKLCTNSLTCPLCFEAVDNLEDHIQDCCQRLYHCDHCNDCFNTGIKRKAHQSTCGILKKLKASLMDLFHVKILNLPNSKDHEGVLNNHKNQIAQTLKYLITTGLKFYLGAQVKMLKQINGNTVNVVQVLQSYLKVAIYLKVYSIISTC